MHGAAGAEGAPQSLLVVFFKKNLIRLRVVDSRCSWVEHIAQLISAALSMWISSLVWLSVKTHDECCKVLFSRNQVPRSFDEAVFD